ncbi:MAG: hypothetical protein HY560_12290 [Gemmatimonadetes bacterium]|nr:hypothetical protein [Gemmatimonadota bacterium]
MHHVVHHEHRILERGRPAGLHAPALVDRDVHDHAARAHGANHLLGDEERRAGARNEDGADHDVGDGREARQTIGGRQLGLDLVAQLPVH